MDALTMIKERRSVRKFKEQKVDREIIKEIISITRYSPSWANTQVPRYTIVDDTEALEKLADTMKAYAFNMKTTKRAAGALVLSAVKGKCGYLSGDKPATKKSDSWEMFDAGIAAQTFCLAAHEKGIGTVILGIFDEDKIAELINLPENEVVECVIPFGYPESDEFKPAPKRLSLDEIVRFI